MLRFFYTYISKKFKSYIIGLDEIQSPIIYSKIKSSKLLLNKK